MRVSMTEMNPAYIDDASPVSVKARVRLEDRWRDEQRDIRTLKCLIILDL